MQSEDVINSLNKSLSSDSDDEMFNDFVRRVQTYIDGQRWIKKPLALSPTVCSQYGWKCIKSDLLECVTCSAKLSASESKIGNYVAYKACVEKTLNCLKDNHGKHCPWPLTPSPENFVKMTPIPKEEALSQFMKRVESSLFFLSSLPKIKECVISDMGLSDQQIKSLCKLANVNNKEACLLGKSIVALAAAGWIVSEELESKKSFLKCNNCLRSVWSGSFSLYNLDDLLTVENESSETNISGESSDNSIVKNEDKENLEEPPAKRKRISFDIKKGDPFDPLHEHRPWCLWIHSGIDSYTSSPKEDTTNKNLESTFGAPGWKIFVKSLLRNISHKQISEVGSPSKEQIRNVKSLLEKWTDV